MLQFLRPGGTSPHCFSCADPGSFVRGGPTLITFLLCWWGEVGSKYDFKWATIGPFRWRADDGQILNDGLVALWFFRRSGPVLLKKTHYILWFFSGPYPLSLPLDPRMLLFHKIHCGAVSWKRQVYDPCSQFEKNPRHHKSAKRFFIKISKEALPGVMLKYERGQYK